MKNISKTVRLFALVGIGAAVIVWGIFLSGDVIRWDVAPDYEIVAPTAYARYTDEGLGLSITYPETVHMLNNNDHELMFSLSSSEDATRQSSVGLMNVLTINKSIPAPNEYVLTAHDDESGIRKRVYEKMDPRDGAVHRARYFMDYGITARYVVSSSTEAVFERMLRTVNFTSLPEIVLVDGEEILGGVFHDAPVVAGLKSFASSALGVSFSYPASHVLFVYEKLFPNHYSISIVPKEPMLDALRRARAGSPGEGPPGMGISFIPVDQSVSVETWIRTDSRSNFDSTLPPGGQQKDILMPTVVAGVPAFTYYGAGLYLYHSVVFRHGQWIVIISAASGDDSPNKNLKPLIESLKLNKAS